jgi:hypothetical protein
MEQDEASGGECNPNDSDPRNSTECRQQGGEYHNRSGRFRNIQAPIN